MRRLLLLLGVALLATIAVGAHAAVMDVTVEDVTSFACTPAPPRSQGGGPPHATTTTTASTGCQTRVVCPPRPGDTNPPIDNDSRCDGNQGVGDP